VPFRDKTGEAPMRFDLRLRGDGDLRVETDFAQLALTGDLQLVGNSDSVGLLGSVGSKDGLVEFRGNQYHLNDVSLTFGASDRIAPYFDVTADTETRQYRVFVHAYGTPGDYKLALRSQPTLAEDDIVKLLTFGVTSRDTASNLGTAGEAGFLGDVLWNISGLKSEVKKLVPRNPLIKDFSVNVGSAFLESVGQVEPVMQMESRVLTDALHLRAQVPLSEYSGKRAEAEYRLSDHISLQGDWNNDYSDYNVGDFGLDLRMRWELGQ
jgi:translocation and assembly module TamB